MIYILRNKDESFGLRIEMHVLCWIRVNVTEDDRQEIRGLHATLSVNVNDSANAFNFSLKAGTKGL